MAPTMPVEGTMNTKEIISQARKLRTASGLPGSKWYSLSDEDKLPWLIQAALPQLGFSTEWAVQFEKPRPTRMDLPYGVDTVTRILPNEQQARIAVNNAAPMDAREHRAVQRLVSPWQQ